MPTLFLDRDGVINHDSTDFIKSAADWRPIAGSLEAIVRAQRHGFRIIVVSNQSGLGRGLFGIRALNQIHNRLQHELGRIGGRIDAFLFCPHHPEAGCTCRKPAPGLLHDAGTRLGIKLARATFIGDRMTDVAAATAAGIKPMIVASGLETPPEDAGLTIYSNLSEAIDALLTC